MHTKLRAWSIGMLEAALLVGAVAIPLFVNYYGFRVFELGKGKLLLTLGVVAGVWAMIALLEGGAEALGRFLGALRRPLPATASLLLLATAMATVASRLPMTSFLGAPERQQGLVHLAAAVVLFAGAATVARHPDRRIRLLATLAAASVPVALYALTQAAGLEAVAGRAEDVRVFGTISNPIFLGAYLMLLAPISAGLAWRSARAGRIAVTAAWTVVLALQVIALVLTASRGPVLGLGVGALVALMAAAAAGQRRALGFGMLGLIVAGLLGLGLLNWGGGPLAGLQDAPVIGRFGRIASLEEGSQAVRLEIWRSTAELITEEPARLLFGHGPETLRVALLPYGETGLGGEEQGDRVVDRAHSVPLDALTMTGVLGLVARLALWAAWLITAVAVMGLAPSRGDRMVLAGLLGIGALLGAASWFVWPPFAGALMALGMLAGLLVFLVAALGGRRSRVAVDPIAWAMLAVGAAAVGEAAFGIQTIVTEVVWWTLAGVLVALKIGEPDETPAAAPSRARRASRGRSGGGDEEGVTITPTFSGPGVALGVVFGIAASIAMYVLWLEGLPTQPDARPILLLLVIGALAGGWIATVTAEEGVAGYIGGALIVAALYTVGRAMALLVARDPSHLLAFTVVWTVVGALMAGALLRKRAPAGAPTIGGPQVAVYPILVLAAAGVIVVAAIQPLRGDIYFQQAVIDFRVALQNDDEQRFQQAEARFERATELQPRDDGYFLRWGELYTELAQLIPDIQQAAPAYGRAQEVLAMAESINPEMATHTFNRGHLQLLFAERLASSGAGDAVSAAADAEVALQAAFDELNYEAQVANELALARLLQGKVPEAVQLLEYSRDFLDEDNAQTWQLLARAYEAAGRQDDAQTALSRASELGGEAGQPGALLRQGDMAREQGNLEAALNYYEQAVEALGANIDWRVLFNMGLLYRDTGRPREAISALQQALALADTQQASDTIQAALAELLSDGAVPPEGFPGGGAPNQPVPVQPNPAP